MSVNYLDDGLKGWIAKTARNNLWKVGAWYDLDDLIQEGFVVYCKCLNRFRPFVPSGTTAQIEAQHKRGLEEQGRRSFTAYFKMAYENHLKDLARDNMQTLDQNFASLPLEKEQEAEANLEVSQPEGTSLHMALLQAPKEVVEVFLALVQDVQDAGTYLRSRLRVNLKSSRLKRGRYRLRETTNEHYERLLGLPGGVDLLKAYLKDV